jgi:hypothetical protein
MGTRRRQVHATIASALLALAGAATADARIIEANAKGIDNVATEACVAGVVRRLQLAAPARSVAVSCEITFGSAAPLR